MERGGSGFKLGRDTLSLHGDFQYFKGPLQLHLQDQAVQDQLDCLPLKMVT
jgi:hypothetical protein